MAEYTTDSNEALFLSLVRSKEDADVLQGSERNVIAEFNPKFTYPIFGEEEKIYGYEDLEIQLKFASGSLQQYLHIDYSSKLSGAGSKVADDVEGTLYKFIPADYLKNEEEFQKRVDKDATAFKPLGKKIYSYARPAEGSAGAAKGKGKAAAQKGFATASEDDEDAVVYEAYWANWETPGFREYHRRMQLFVLLYIEGGSYIQEDEDKWEFVVLYERRRRRDEARTPVYHFVGYSSLYSFYCWPDKVRLRLSQFVISGPYQSQGHGAGLYKAIYDYTLARDGIAELTVEDPSEAFEDLRDKCDLRMLFSHKEFTSEAYGISEDFATDGTEVPAAIARPPAGKGKLGPPTEKDWAERWRKKLKIAGRQFHRLIEMLVLRSLRPDDARLMRAYRLQVKERIFRFNYEILSQLDKSERVEKLEETFAGVREDYRRILGLVE